MVTVEEIAKKIYRYCPYWDNMPTITIIGNEKEFGLLIITDEETELNIPINIYIHNLTELKNNCQLAINNFKEIIKYLRNI